jgi:hypothetical protein
MTCHLNRQKVIKAQELQELYLSTVERYIKKLKDQKKHIEFGGAANGYYRKS